MDSQLTRFLAEKDWIECYRMILPEGTDFIERPGRNEVECVSPFPGSTDKRPSFSINKLTGLWNDQHMRDRLVGTKNNGGNFVMCHAYISFSEMDAKARLHGDFDAAERDIRILFGLANPIDEAWYQTCRARLATIDSPYHAGYQQHKPWDAKIVRELGIGYDTETGRYVFPIYDKRGKLVNCKLYLPGASGSAPKAIWKVEGVGPLSLPFPFDTAWNSSRPFFFTEGEPDATTLRSCGLQAISGCTGANALPFLGNRGSEFCLSRSVTIWADSDRAGEVYAGKAAAVFQPLVSSLRIMQTPEWSGMPNKRDVSDYVQYCLSQGMTMRQIGEHILDLSLESDIIGVEAAFDAEPKEVDFLEAMSPSNFGVRIATNLRIISVGSGRHIVPTITDMTCNMSKGTMCTSCPMSMNNGSMRSRIDHRSATALDISMCNADTKTKLLKMYMHIPPRCDEVRFDSAEILDVQIAQASMCQFSERLDTIAAEDAHSRRIEVVYIGHNPTTLEPGIDYSMRGFLLPHGKTQRAILLVDHAEIISHMNADLQLSPEQCAKLRKTFSPPGYSAFQALRRIANHIARSVTGIQQRPDMHMLYNAVWFSAISFDLAGEHVSRGWLETFVIGDTRCGKSASFKAMMNWYNVGVLLDCKMQTVPGLLGAVETSNITGERYVLPGVIPMNDKRGPLGFDEFSGPRQGRQSLIEALSSTRAEGVARINKAAHANFNARVPSIWMGNPGDGRMMCDIPGYGVERFKWLVGQPEDVARFDAAMAVTQQDVSIEVLLRPVVLEETIISREMSQTLLEWARTREASDFYWTEDAITTLSSVARRMITDYDQSIPLVESATQRLKIAKVAVANAMATFSSPDGKRVIITHDHVTAAYQMFNMWYTKPSFGYHAYSVKRRRESTLADEDGMKKFLETKMGDNLLQTLSNLLRSDSFDEAGFRIMCALPMDDQVAVLRHLSSFRAIEPDGKRQYRLTRAMIVWINNYVAMRTNLSGERNENKVTNGRDRVSTDRVSTDK